MFTKHARPEIKSFYTPSFKEWTTCLLYRQRQSGFALAHERLVLFGHSQMVRVHSVEFQLDLSPSRLAHAGSRATRELSKRRYDPHKDKTIPALMYKH